MMDADFCASQAQEVLLSHVSARAIEAVCFLMINSLDLEPLMKVILRRRSVGMHNLSLRDAGANE